MRPLGDREPGRAGGLGIVRNGHTDVVDQTQSACKRRGDGEVGLGKRLVHTGERLSVIRAHRIVDGAPERLGEVLDRASRSGVLTSWCGLNQMHQHPTVRRRGLVRLCRVGPAQRALDQTADDSRVDASELIVDLSTRVRRDCPGVEDTREVVQQPCLGLGDSFVAHRQEHGGRACGRCDHARTQMHAPARASRRWTVPGARERRQARPGSPMTSSMRL